MASREGGGGPPAGRVGRTREYRTGMQTELLSIDAPPSVSLFVLCGDRFEAAHLFRSGALSLHMARVEGVPVSMATCAVGDHHWMLARDALVARIDARAFVFELPGFFYAVVVPPGAAADRKCATMADIFSRFCAYHDLATAADDGNELAGEAVSTNPWVRAHAVIQRLKRHASPAAGRQATADDASPSSDRARQMERAVRTSAVVKLLTRSLLAGVLQPGRHLTITTGGGGGGAANAGTSSRPSTTAALPSKSAVSDLLDAIETNRAVPRCDTRRASGGGLGWWSLNVEGVMLLLRVVQAVRGRKNLAAPAAGEKRPRDAGPGRDTMRGGVMGGGGAARRWCGGRPRKIGNTVGACGSS
ncbi:uncharacterized protein LOC100274777 [Zea mays]|uniref:Uncharacterized protein n=1 Tax=Zea mays TaxID=4577 RepID=A0A096SBP5_MAIZE|nr:uncharacterized protein LOC100274777 [Zea mays]ONM21627.1 hypothetical protein ZEAMMB73_Zm00001d005659 [Zea mays]|eukprot:NP_001142534.2 uncharacterized protein LOC100274777 [Zea mays]